MRPPGRRRSRSGSASVSFTDAGGAIYAYGQQSAKRAEAYVSALRMVGGAKFVDVVRGQHYYRETDFRKSNVFSLNVRNSGLAYETYTYDEMVSELRRGYGLTDMSGLSAAFARSRFGVLEGPSALGRPTEGLTAEGYAERLKGCSFFVCAEDPPGATAEEAAESRERQRRTLEMKAWLRSLFEEAVRKSIARYAPAHTVLWRIEYDR